MRREGGGASALTSVRRKTERAAVVTRLVPVTEAVDPHPGHSVTHGIGEENVGKQV